MDGGLAWRRAKKRTAVGVVRKDRKDVEKSTGGDLRANGVKDGDEGSLGWEWEERRGGDGKKEDYDFNDKKR